jgi:gluconolactonase
MPIEILSDVMKKVVGPQQDAEELGSGFGGPNGPTEGPVWWKERNYLLFSDIHGSRRMKWEPGGGMYVG